MLGRRSVDSRWPEVNNSRVAMRRDVSTVWSELRAASCGAASGRSSCRVHQQLDSTPRGSLVGGRWSESESETCLVQESASATGTRYAWCFKAAKCSPSLGRSARARLATMLFLLRYSIPSTPADTRSLFVSFFFLLLLRFISKPDPLYVNTLLK